MTNFSESFSKRQIHENRIKGRDQISRTRWDSQSARLQLLCDCDFFYLSEKRFSSGFKIKRVHLNSISLWAHVNLGLNASSLLWPRFQIKLFRSNSACWLLHLKCKLDTRTNKNKKDKTSSKNTVPTYAYSWKSWETFLPPNVAYQRSTRFGWLQSMACYLFVTLVI